MEDFHITSAIIPQHRESIGNCVEDVQRWDLSWSTGRFSARIFWKDMHAYFYMPKCYQRCCWHVYSKSNWKTTRWVARHLDKVCYWEHPEPGGWWHAKARKEEQRLKLQAQKELRSEQLLESPGGVWQKKTMLGWWWSQSRSWLWSYISEMIEDHDLLRLECLDVPLV